VHSYAACVNNITIYTYNYLNHIVSHKPCNMIFLYFKYILTRKNANILRRNEVVKLRNMRQGIETTPLRLVFHIILPCAIDIQ